MESTPPPDAPSTTSAPPRTLTPASLLLDPSARASIPYNFPFAAFLATEHAYPKPLKPYKPTSSLVCKHWLRGLCKKGGACEFLHEYNLRAMPACATYERFQSCPNGSDCLFLHIDQPDQPCPWFERGFCPLGPACADAHVKTPRLCPCYIAGFCPDGHDCERGAHPLWREKGELGKLRLRKVLTEDEKREEKERAAEKVEKEREAIEERTAGGAEKTGSRGRGRRGWQGKRRERY